MPSQIVDVEENNDSVIYKFHPPTASEFSSDEEPLTWDADGWDNVTSSAELS